MRRRMGEFERLYFQWARGRAIVVKHRMDKARAEKRAGSDRMVSWHVKLARQANRDWRNYRREMMDCRQKGI